MGKASEAAGVAVEQVTARTLRRHTARLENRSAELHCDLQSLLTKLDRLMDRLAEQAERLRVIEGDVEKIHRNMGVMARRSIAHVPVIENTCTSGSAHATGELSHLNSREQWAKALEPVYLSQFNPLRRV